MTYTDRFFLLFQGVLPSTCILIVNKAAIIYMYRGPLLTMIIRPIILERLSIKSATGIVGGTI